MAQKPPATKVIVGPEGGRMVVNANDPAFAGAWLWETGSKSVGKTALGAGSKSGPAKAVGKAAPPKAKKKAGRKKKGR